MWMSSARLVVGVGLLLTTVPLLAHHSFSAEFDIDKPITLTGTLTELQWINPHGWIHMEVVGDNDTTVNWAVELGSPTALLRRGLRKKIRESGIGYRSSAKRSLSDLTYTPKTDATRFEIATISPALFSGLGAAVEECRKSGPAGIERRIRRLANRLLRILGGGAGIEMLTPPGPVVSFLR